MIISAEEASILIWRLLCGKFAEPERRCPLKSQANENCDRQMDSKLTHASICPTKTTERHDLLCNSASVYLRKNGINVTREVIYANEETNRRRARPGDLDLWTVVGNKYTHWVLDFSVVSEYHGPREYFTSSKSGGGRKKTHEAEQEKIRKHRGSFQNDSSREFAPMVCSTSGGWGSLSRGPFNEIAKNLAQNNFTTQKVEQYKLRAHLTITLCTLQREPIIW